MESFKHLGLSDEVLKGIEELGFETPSEIQTKSIPQLIQGDRDFIGLAQTGTGKTAAFSLPLLERIDSTEKFTQALILAPTRELGQQIAGQIEKFSKYLDGLNILAVYGGAPITTQIKALRKPQHIIIATPGRLIDLIQRKAVKLDQLDVVILDEADEMLNMGFKQEIDKILSFTPEEKLVWLFSATMSGEIRRIVKKYMDQPVEVRLNNNNEVNVNIEHQFAIVKQSHKAEALTRFLDVDPDLRGVVFCRTRRDTQSLADELLKKNYKSDALHGDLSQKQRDIVMNRFKQHELQVLVATDVAARGIDVDDLTHVFHHSLPDDIAYYTHRSGRTARAGKKGKSIAFINGREKSKIDRIVKELDISFERVMIPEVKDIYHTKIDNWCQQILDQQVNGNLNPELFDKVQEKFDDLSKEELTARLLLHELDKFQMNTTQDLNEKVQRGGGDRAKGTSNRKGGDRFYDQKKGRKRSRNRSAGNKKRY